MKESLNIRDFYPLLITRKVKKASVKAGIFLLSFTIGWAVIAAAGNYRKAIETETGSFYLNLPVSQEKKVQKELVFDIQDEGLPKRLIQPGRITISGKTITNKSKEPLFLKVRVEGITAGYELTSKDMNFIKESGSFKKAIQAEGKTNVSLSIDIPRENLFKNGDIEKGKVVFLNEKTEEVLAEVPLRVVNSK